MNELVNDKQTHQELKRDPTPALQRKVNNKLLTLNKLNAIDTRRYYRLRCSVPQAPKLYGVPKLHKPNTPMRPIVSHCGSPTYQLSKYLTTILQPLTNESQHKVQSTKDFIDTIKKVQIPDDYKVVSFDVKSLFTSIPLQLALDCTETAITNSTRKLPLPNDDIMDLLKLCLTCSFFQYNGKHYKQLHGTAMGSPVSGVVAEIVMQNIEQQALATYKETLPLWLRYVDDTFTAVHKDEIDFLHEHLNKQNTYIQFTREIEENGKIPFLDCLASRDNNKIRTTIYRKPTNSDRLLDQCSYHPTCHKATAVRTLTRRAHLVCDSPKSLSSEAKHLHDVFHMNNYNQDFISRNYYRDNGPNSTNTRPTTVTIATVPYIKGTSETIARILQPHGMRVAHKPITTFRQLLTNVKDKVEPKNRQGAVYKIKCCDCPATYVGETGRNLNTRLTEHRRATKNGDNKNNIAEHNLQTDHRIDWDSAECISFSTDYYQRLTLESWFTNLERTPLNRCQQLPGPYKRLINDKQTEITKKAAKRIYFLLQLKRAGVSKDDLLTFYKSCIRSVLDYAVPVFHTSLPRYLMSDLERIQKRVLSIIIPGEGYYKALENVNLVPLEKHHDDICSSLFEAILKDESHRLRKRLPPVVTQNYNLRKARNFNVITKTKRTRNSFINFHASSSYA